MSKNMALAVVTAAVLAVLGLHVLMARKGPVWLGAVIPALYAVGVIVLVGRGQLEPGRPYVVAVAGLVMLLWMWASAHQSRKGADNEEPASSLSQGT